MWSAAAVPNTPTLTSRRRRRPPPPPPSPLLLPHPRNETPDSSPNIHRLLLPSNPSPRAIPPLIKSHSHSLPLGRQLHAHVLKLNLSPNVFIAVSVMDMYMKNGDVGSARKLFDGMPDRDGVAWNALITGYCRNGMPEEAVEVFGRMRVGGVGVSDVAAASVVTACGKLRMVDLGNRIHSLVVKSGFEADVVISTALLDMYANCGDLRLANQIFQEMHTKDSIAWNCLISCCAQYGLTEDAFKLFVDMQYSGLKPNGSSLAGILPAVARSGTLLMGKSCHGFVVRNGLNSDEFVMTALLDVYAKSGDLVVANKLFRSLFYKTVVAWSAIITGYGSHGCGAEAMDKFEKMLASDVRPNHITYVGVLSACAHAGFVDKGREYFRRMVEEHGIMPNVQHYTCMVDLLGRAGLFSEALDLIETMPFDPTSGIWGALLGACKIYGNVELAKYSAERLFELNPSDPGFYVLLSNIYAAAGMWSEVRQVRSLMRQRGLRKPAGWSLIEIGSKVSCFASGDMSHPNSCEIHQKIEELMKETGELGYVPKTKVVLHDVEEDVKVSILKSHSEKLAMAYGLLKTKVGSPIRIVKNLRTCEDCHNFAKFVSKVASREIVLRDAVRFHHMKNGTCTCLDYW